jgi:hypothetical protein
MKLQSEEFSLGVFLLERFRLNNETLIDFRSEDRDPGARLRMANTVLVNSVQQNTDGVCGAFICELFRKRIAICDR